MMLVGHQNDVDNFTSPKRFVNRSGRNRRGIPTHVAAFGILPEARWAYRTAAGSTSNFQNLSGWK